jgi:uncharacterized protein
VIPELAWAFFTGLVGSLHCLGMCGPLVVAYSLRLRPKENTSSVTVPAWSRGLKHHLMFHLGRVTTYGLLGALTAGFVCLGLGSTPLMKARSLAVLAGGAAMVIFGLILLRITPNRSALTTNSGRQQSFLSRFMIARLASTGPASGLMLGMAAGFLPCMLSWAMVIKAATAESLFVGFSTMVLFGLGTVPALFFTGFFASLFSLRMRLAGERIAAVSLVIMGLILLWKGVVRLV